MKKVLIIIGTMVLCVSIFLLIIIAIDPLERLEDFLEGEEFVTTDIADYGVVKGNYDNESAAELIGLFFPEKIEDYFSEVRYSYKAKEGDTCGFEAYLEFVIEDPGQYEQFVEENTKDLTAKSFLFDSKFVEYVYYDDFELTLHHGVEREKEGHTGIDFAEIGKILCCTEEQRIIFVAMGVYDGGGTTAEFLNVFFERFGIHPRGYVRQCTPDNRKSIIRN